MSDENSKLPWAPVAHPHRGTLPLPGGCEPVVELGPLTPAGLRGRIVAVDFCTYTCINWIRSLPYVRAWAETYVDQGLVVIGVHTPEFSFERDVENIRRALADMRVEYPIAIDSDYGVWNAFANHYWPALYLIDAEGRIRHHRFGEGDYDRSEVIIRRLLADAGADEIGEDFAPVDLHGPEVQADWDSLETAETYLGYRQTQGFASPGGVTSDIPRQYDLRDVATQPLGALRRLDHRGRGRPRTNPRVGSRSGSTPATCTSSWVRMIASIPSDSG